MLERLGTLTIAFIIVLLFMWAVGDMKVTVNITKSETKQEQ
jgi:hypothetical protein